MRSHLTRRVFRLLLLDQPVIRHEVCRHSVHRHHQCRGIAGRPTTARLPNKLHNFPNLGCVSYISKRTIFGLFEKTDREAVALNLDPGLDTMLELDRRLHLKARTPSADQLVKAFNAFFAAKSKRNRLIEDFHASLLYQTLEAILSQEEGLDNLISQTELSHNLTILAASQSQFTGVHIKLARQLYKAITERNDVDPSQNRNIAFKSLAKLILVMCRAGRSLEARGLLESWMQENSQHNMDLSSPWVYILQGLTKEDNVAEFGSTVRTMREHGIDFTTQTYRALAIFYAKHDNIEKTLDSFKPEILDQVAPKPEHHSLEENVYQVLLEFSIRNKQIEWAQTNLTYGADQSPDRNNWDAIFGAAAATGKSVEDIDKMIGVVVRRAQGAKVSTKDKAAGTRPDIGIFNSLIRYAISRNDAYTAERYFQLLEKWKALPNTVTYNLQVQYRLAAGDLDGAMAAYRALDGLQVPDGGDWAITNKLLQVLVSSPNAKTKDISRVIEDVSERRKVIYSSTIMALCRYHLRKDEYFELVDLLHTYSYQFSTRQRTEIREVLSSYTLNPSTDTGRAWDSYMIFHQVFDQETRRNIHNKVMTNFFERGRADLAMHVFTQMTKHPRADTRPDITTYVRAFEGIALSGELEYAEAVHNLFKLDTEVEPCTKVMNAMMLAYGACNESSQGLEIWQDIAASDEGPDLQSINIALQVCEGSSFGVDMARTIWSKLHETDIVIDNILFSNYVAVLVRAMRLDDVKTEVAKMYKVTGKAPDVYLMGVIFNSALGGELQESAQKFIMDEYPHLWTEIERRGFEEDEIHNRKVKGIDRTLKA